MEIVRAVWLSAEEVIINNNFFLTIKMTTKQVNGNVGRLDCVEY